MRNLRTEDQIIAHWEGNPSEPLVSICCITYNHEHYINDALEGFLTQETNFPFEILIHDDASIDKTTEIIRKYHRLYPNIISVVCQTENQYSKLPIISPRFLFPIARGEYIALCEGDDYWTDPLKLCKQIRIMSDNPGLSACAHQSSIYKNNSFCGHFKDSVPNYLTKNNLLRGRMFHTASFLFRRRIIQSASPWPTIVSGDRFIFLLASVFGDIYYSSESMCVYRKHKKGASTNTSIDKILLDLNMLKLLKNIDPHFPKNECKSYIFATAAFTKSARYNEVVKYSMLSLFYSFSYFPRNLQVVFDYLLRSIKKRF